MAGYCFPFIWLITNLLETFFFEVFYLALELLMISAFQRSQGLANHNLHSASVDTCLLRMSFIWANIVQRTHVVKMFKIVWDICLIYTELFSKIYNFLSLAEFYFPRSQHCLQMCSWQPVINLSYFTMFIVDTIWVWKKVTGVCIIWYWLWYSL